MDKKYKVKVNGSREFKFTKAEVEALDAQQVSSSNFHVLHEHKSFHAAITQKNFLHRDYQVSINSNVYKVTIDNPLDLLIEKMGLSLSSAQLVNEVTAPMPGLILEVNVKEGDKVEEGDYLLVLEAMKMENTISAPREGIIKSIAIKKGQTVEKKQLLIEFEAD